MKIDPEFEGLREALMTLAHSPVPLDGGLGRIVENEAMVFDLDAEPPALEIIELADALPAIAPEIAGPLALALLRALSRAQWKGTMALTSIEVLPTPFNSAISLGAVLGTNGDVAECVEAPAAPRLPGPLVAMMPDAYDIVGTLAACRMDPGVPIVFLPRDAAADYMAHEGRWWSLAGRGRVGMAMFRILHALRLTPRFERTARLMHTLETKLDSRGKDILDHVVPIWREGGAA